MSRRPHQCKRPLAREGSARDLCARTRGSDGVIINFRIGGRIETEISARIFDELYVLWRMRAQQLFLGRRRRFAPIPFWMSLFQNRNSTNDSRWPLRMTGCAILDAVRVVKNKHEKMVTDGGITCNIREYATPRRQVAKHR